MTENDRDLLKDKLQKLSHRIEERTREFAEKGVLSEADDARLRGIRAKHEQLHHKFDGAVEKGDVWAAFKAEFHLDLESLIDEFTRWEKDLEARTMRSGQA